MREPLGTRVNLREVLSKEGLKNVRKGDLLHFEMADGTETWIRAIRAGFLRYEGEIVEAPKTMDEVREENDRLMAEELAKEGFVPTPEDVTAQVEVVRPKRARKKKEVSDGV